MKKLFLGLMCFLSTVAIAQVDTTTLIQKADYHISSVAGKSLIQLPPLGITRSLQSLRNVAVGYGVSKTIIPIPASNNFLNPDSLKVGFYVNTSGGLSATSNSFAVYVGQWGANTSFVAGGNGVQFSMFSIAQYNSSGAVISGTYAGTDNVMNPTKHASAATFKVTLRVANINQLNWGSSVLTYDAYSPASSYQISNSDASGASMTFEPNLRSTQMLALLPTYDKINKSAKQQQGINGAYTVIKVKKDGTGNFTNLMAASASITDASPTNKYLIEVYDDHIGTIKTDFTTVPTAQTYKAMLHVKDNVKVVGIGGPKIIHGELPVSGDVTLADYTNYETCHMEGNSEVDNLIITANRIRYPIHYDHGNTSVNQNAIMRVTNCHVEHYGSLDVPSGVRWTATDAIGIGTTANCRIVIDHTKVVGSRYGLRVHTAAEAVGPDYIDLKYSSILSKLSDGAAFNFDNLGARQRRYVSMTGSTLQGYGNIVNAVDVATSITKALPSVVYRGSANPPFYFNNVQNVGSVLRIVSTTTGATSFVKVVQDDAGLFGTTTEKPGSLGLAGLIYGDNELVAAGTTKTNIIGHRLGNCTTVNKLLVLNIDGTNRTITFNQNYSGGAAPTANPAIDATTILASINSALSGFATASYYQVNLDYFPELDDVLFYKGNTSTTSFIPRKRAVKNVGLNRCRIAVADEIPDGFAIDDIPVSSVIMQMGRVIKNTVVVVGSNACPDLEPGSESFTEGTCFKISANGKLQIDPSVKTSFAVALDATRILLK